MQQPCITIWNIRNGAKMSVFSKIITLDFETYFDDAYTLKKLTTEEYIRSPQFEAHGLGIRVGDDERFWVPQELIKSTLDAIDWSVTAVLAHHAQFDGLILSHHYGVTPAFWFDTMAMARMVRGAHHSAALGALAHAYGTEEKSVPYDIMRGVRWCNMDEGLRRLLGEGCLQDCALTWDLFKKLAPGFPPEELRLIDLTIRMFTEPKIEGDVPLLERIKLEEWESKGELMDQLEVTKSDLMSAKRFVMLLEREGVDVEWKQGKNGLIPAVAATDDFMKALVDSSDERIAALAEARLGAKSTLQSTRSARLAASAARGRIPVYLHYYGAHTGRWSGGDRINLQNLPRGSKLRSALHAPKGHVLSIVDAAQIECRILNAFADQWDVVEAFRSNEDLYSRMAERVYGFIVTKKDNPSERHLGKILELGCGYNMGAQKLQITCRRGALGGPPILLSDTDAEQAIKAYRSSHQAVVALWRTAGTMITALAQTDEPLAWGCLTVSRGKITLPNGAILHYPELEWGEGPRGGEWTYKTRKGRVKIYGGKLVENVIQALARLATAQAMLRIHAAGIKIATMSHDEVVSVVPDTEAEAQHEFVVQEMSRAVDWLPECPLVTEGYLTERYTK